MPRKKALTTDDERGSAPIEFIGMGVILLVPLVYVILALGAIQQHTLGAEAAARHTARAISLAPDAASATSRTDRVIASVLHEYGMSSEKTSVNVSCHPSGVSCPSAGARVHVRVNASVPLPFVPSVLGLDHMASVPVVAESVAQVSSMWSE